MREFCDDPLASAVKTLFGLDYLFPYQRLVITNMLEAARAAGVRVVLPGEESETEEAEDNPALSDATAYGRQLVILPTGAGKSLCFQFPAMVMEGATLVIYPILSLMADQERRLAERGFSPVVLRGGQSAAERDAIWEAVQTGKSRFIIANPEVLLSPKVNGKLGSLGIAHVVIDEAHCVSEWGDSFRPAYLRVGEILEACGAPLVTAFTATASPAVLEKIERYIFGGQGAHHIIGNPDRINIRYNAQAVVARDLAVAELLAKSEKPAIVFCSSRHGTETLARYLRAKLDETEVRFYHAGLERAEKDAVEKWFFASKNGILTATCAYGMGVDKSDIRTVIHRDCPPSVEAYLQESGRAGRDGNPSQAFFLWGTDDDFALQRAKTPADRKRLEALFTWARNTDACRRDGLLAMLGYDGEVSRRETDCCDVCMGETCGETAGERAALALVGRNARAFSLREAANEYSLADEPLLDALLSKAGQERPGLDEARALLSGLLKNGKLREAGGLWGKRLTLAHA
jgi:ATP-dependent DNA helicase RecQ